MPSSPPDPIDYTQSPFDHVAHPKALAALLSADPIIDPTDDVRWQQRDLNELVSRGWATPFRMRVDRLWAYQITEIGACVKESFEEEGFTFDGWEAWDPEGNIVR